MSGRIGNQADATILPGECVLESRFLMKHRVLVVEDDGNLSALLRENLAFEGF